MKKKMMIGIPTKDHPDYIRFYLSEILPEAEKEKIDVWIYDSSSDDATQEIVGKKAKRYANLFYKRLPKNIPYWKKLRYIFVESGYDYVWLCGDGIVICLDRCMDIIREEISKNRDLIVFDNAGRARDIEMHDIVSLAENCLETMGVYGHYIIRGNLFTVEEWEYFERKYPDWMHIGPCFEKLATEKINAVCVKCNFYKPNYYKKNATWVTGGRVFDVMENWIKAIKSLPDLYNPMKQMFIDRYISHYTTTDFLWLWRMDGNLDYSIALRHIRLVYGLGYRGKKYCCIVVFISLCPKIIADLLCTIYGSKLFMYK